MMGKIIDLTGRKFGRLTVVKRADKKGSHSYWHCVCTCGKETVSSSSHLLGGDSASCGCLRIERAVAVNTIRNTKHGKHKTPEYSTWQGMIQRCTNPKNRGWKDYGGRGVTVCEGWRNFSVFIEDMGERPSKEYSLDRIENSAGYHCGHCEQCIRNGWIRNCRWTTWGVQAHNRRERKDYSAMQGEKHHQAKLTKDDVVAIRQAFDGVRGTATRLSKQYGISVSQILSIVKGKSWAQGEYDNGS